jgi:protein-disulfide isomerase
MKVVIYVLTLCLLISCSSSPTSKSELQGKLLPNIEMKLIDGVTSFNTVNVPFGKTTAIFYFSPNCPYCRAQVSEILENSIDFRNLQFYMVTNSTFSEVKPFCQEFELNKYPNITVVFDTKYRMANYLRLPGVPYIVVFGKDKRVKGAYLGKTNSADIFKLINS